MSPACRAPARVPHPAPRPTVLVLLIALTGLSLGAGCRLHRVDPAPTTLDGGVPARALRHPAVLLGRAARGGNPDGRINLRIAAGFNFLGCVIPDVVREFNECFPRAMLSIRAAERDDALQLLRDREVDAAIMVEPPEDGPEFTYHKLFDDEPRLVMNSRNPLAPLEVVPVRNLANKTLLVSRHDSHTIRALRQQMSRKGVEFRDVVAVGGATAICEMVKLGQGVALLPDWVVRHVAPSPFLVTRPIDGLRLTRTWAFVCSSWTMPTLALRTFRRLSRQAVAKLASTANERAPADVIA